MSTPWFICLFWHKCLEIEPSAEVVRFSALTTLVKQLDQMIRKGVVKDISCSRFTYGEAQVLFYSRNTSKFTLRFVLHSEGSRISILEKDSSSPFGRTIYSIDNSNSCIIEINRGLADRMLDSVIYELFPETKGLPRIVRFDA